MPADSLGEDGNATHGFVDRVTRRRGQRQSLFGPPQRATQSVRLCLVRIAGSSNAGQTRRDSADSTPVMEKWSLICRPEPN
jgi:hypothetical protein